MEKNLQQVVTTNNKNWLNLLENITVASSLGGTLVAIITEQIVFASVPLSLSVALNLINRRRLLELNNQKNQIVIASLIAENQVFKEQINSLQLTTEKYDVVGQDFTDIANKIAAKQDKLEELFHNFKKELLSKSVALQDNSATEYFYEKGIASSQAEDLEKAVEFFAQAIINDSSNADAFYQRGLSLSQLNKKQKAVEDFRQAAKLYFHAGDLLNYRKAKAAINNVHQIENKIPENNQGVMIDNLFT